MSRWAGLSRWLRSSVFPASVVRARRRTSRLSTSPAFNENEIRVAALYSDEGDPTNGKNEDAVDGTKAYFEYINKSEGGVYGRELVVASEHDDRLANNRQEVQAILSQDDVFAVVPVAAPLFSGAQLLVDAGVPTFGWHVSEEWGSQREQPGPSNLFGDAGGYYCIDCVKLKLENFLSKKLGLERIGVVAYAVPSSAACANGIEKTFNAYPTGEVAFSDKSVPSWERGLQRAGVPDEGRDGELVYPCLDGQAKVVLAREMAKQGLDAIMLAPSLYNGELVEANAETL